ncbi:uncharacterized protein LOC134351471 isoform X7 [Mobula hypostoma]|uniref:uncharacterized protein LOC134351471 isoform X7 n=1 Tax=Mobula hypostoma TaxID=723540 RepID=UPI002FC2DD9A
MRPYDFGCPPRPLHQWAPRDCSQTKKGRVPLCVRDNSQHLLGLGLGRKKTWLYQRRHVKPPLHATHAKCLQWPSHSSANICLSKAGPHYFTFVSRVRLWDRVQTHNPSHLQADPDGTLQPCPRFVAHMSTLSNSPMMPWDFMKAPRTHYPGTMDREPRVPTRKIRTSAAPETWDRPMISGTSSSTDLSQLRCSSISWDSRVSTGSTVPGGSVAPSDTHLRNTSRLVTSGLYRSFVSLDQTVRDRPSTGDPRSVPSSAARQSPTERNPSFVEIWHDRLLNHWPVLPPISPQTGSLEACSCGSDGGANHSYSDLSAYEELDEIIPCTGSSLSHHTLGDTTEEVSDSELNRRSPFSRTTSAWADETLAEARLALLDHQDFIQHWDTNQLGERLAQATTAENTESMARGVGEEDDGKSKINAGSLAPRPAGDSPERKPTPTQRTNKDDVDLDCLTTIDNLSHKAAQSSRTIPSPCSAPIAQESWTAALPEKAHQSEVSVSPGEKGQGSSPPPVSSVSAVTPNLSPAFSHQNVRTLVAGRGSWVSRETSGDLPSGEMTRPRQQPRAGGLRTFRKPWMAESHRQSGPMVTSVSDIREMNFLEKYCIFNQEDLALYKKKFQEVDNNNDGYLFCAELVTALKEMAPLGALTDSEEIYIYRILESLGYRVTDGLIDLRLFTVMVSLAQKITALDGFMRSLIGNMDLKALDLKLYRAKQLFLCSLEAGSNTISVEQLLVELKAGRISNVHEEKVRQELQHTRELDLLDFLTYLPLFVLIHNSVVSNPLDNTPTL